LSNKKYFTKNIKMDVEDRLWEMRNKFFLTGTKILQKFLFSGTKMYGFFKKLIYFLINSYFNQFSTIFFGKVIYLSLSLSPSLSFSLILRKDLTLTFYLYVKHLGSSYTLISFLKKFSMIISFWIGDFTRKVAFYNIFFKTV